MSGPQRFRRRGPLLELAPGCWLNVAGVTAVLPADPADGADGLAVVEADGRPYCVRPVPAVVAQAVADAMLDWAGERAQAEEDGRWLARERAGEAFRDRDRNRDRRPMAPHGAGSGRLAAGRVSEATESPGA
jgi:hypothetical protein